METPVLEPGEAYALWAKHYPPRAHNPFMQAEERAMLALLPTDLSGCQILDAGCGSGRYMRQALLRGAAAVVGIDLSTEMLRRAQGEVLSARAPGLVERWQAALARASLEAVPIRDDWADITLCGLTLGHLSDLPTALAELRRVTRPGGTLLCSDFHPAGEAIGWKRIFKANGRRYAVRHTTHTLDVWRAACQGAGLTLRCVVEPRLDPADIPRGVHLDPAALETPVALIVALGFNPH